ncbi:MAG: fatty acid desaturase [Verrucomicrobiae bacterium]|nr:fatty acid desaturase [Verrucomicrobiae bacterium]MCP5541061.1 fatty acid desaturase [Akkermansiaceae bacterium]
MNELRTADNWRNWFCIAREYLVIAAAIGAAVWFFENRAAWGLGWGWNLPAAALAILLVGIGQHRLVMLGHEASHWVLFKNRLLNEVAANWCCFFPMWGRSYNYRVQHFAHHQHVNDPEKDPVVIDMTVCGNKFRHPMPLVEFIWECLVKLPLWVPGLIRYAIARARYATLGERPDVYRSSEPPSKVTLHLNAGYLLLLIGMLVAGVSLDLGLFFLLGIPALWLGLYLSIASRIASHHYGDVSRLKPDVAPRLDNHQTIAFITILFTGLALLTHHTDLPWVLYYLVLWLVPLFTSFAWLMILREDIQHAHTGRAGFSHTRNFSGNPLFRWIVFPYHMDLHLPHHLYPFVPCHNLPKLHALLRETNVYRRHAIEVDGHLLHHGHS